MIEQVVNTQTAVPLPPLLSLDPRKRRPPEQLIEEMGPMYAAYIHNYQEAGPIYRYLDLYTNKVKTVLTGVEANLFAMRHAKTLLSARGYRQKQIEELESDKYMVGMDGDEHYHLRKLQKPGYSRSVLEGRYEELVEIVQRQVAEWQPGQKLSVNPFLQRMITEQLGATILNHPPTDNWKAICFYIDAMLSASFASQPLDEQRQLAYEKSKIHAQELADEIITAHQTPPCDHFRPDLVDDLLTAVTQDETLLTEQELRITVLTPYIAGINPVAHTCTFMLYALLARPHVLAEIVAEVDAAFASGPPSPKLLRKMEKLRYAMLESLRMFPFAPVLQMTAIEAFEFAHHLVKPGTHVVIATTVPHYLPDLFANPLQFDIERYGPERAEHRQPGAFAPYGVGPHICLGAGYAEVQIMLTMATLLHTIELETDPSSLKPIVGTRSRNSFHVHVVKKRK